MITVALTIVKYTITILVAPLVVFVASFVADVAAKTLLLFPKAEADLDRPPTGRTAIAECLGAFVAGVAGIIALMAIHHRLFGTPLWFLPMLCVIATGTVAREITRDAPRCVYWSGGLDLGMMAGTVLCLAGMCW